MAALTLPVAISRPSRPGASQPLIRRTLRPPSPNPMLNRAPRRRAGSLTVQAFKGRPQSPEIKQIEEWRVQKMTDMVHEYFDQMLSKGRVELVAELLDPECQHKDMVRDELRRGHEAITSYLKDVHNAYPNFWARAEQVGVADDCTVFCSFEGQATSRTPLFTGVDRFKFNKDLTKIQEVEIYRSNWQGARGHEQRKQERAALQT